jgi:hypothetical protein
VKSYQVLRDDVVNRVEPFLFSQLTHETYTVDVVPAGDLLAAKRFDLAFKLLYLDLAPKHPDLAQEIYRQDIHSQTLGTYSEFGNAEKNSLAKYLDSFRETYESIKETGFDETRTLIPLSCEGTLLNGAHRVSSSIKADVALHCLQTEIPAASNNYEFFVKKGLPPYLLDLAAVKFVEYATNVYLAFLWPSGKQNLKAAEAQFSNIIYKKKISLSPDGGFNLIYELYKHMDWIGSAKNGFPGIKQKLAECFQQYGDVTVIAFQAATIAEVREIKERVRKINNIGFSSVHITDTKEEATRISKLVFNQNGIHFLNYSKPRKSLAAKELSEFRKAISSLDIHPDDIMIDGSLILSLYGLRRASDIDYLALEDTALDSAICEPHDGELKYHAVGKLDLLYDPRYYFEYLGVKFCSLKQLHEMKQNRGEEKDIYDIKIMSTLTESKSVGYWIRVAVQGVLFRQLKVRNFIRQKIILALKKMGLYSIARNVYRKLKPHS